MLGGYTGKILFINLNDKNWFTEEITEDMAKKWLGGSGFAANYILNNVSANTDPLGPDNILGFFTGPLTGTIIPSSGRHCVAGKSPLTGIWGEASIGGNFGRALKYAGYDALIIIGMALEPVYIWIDNGKVEIRPAEEFWGMDTYEIEDAIRKVTHPRAQISSIGPSGEKLSKISGIFTDGYEGRTAARCGLGAIAGAKKVKAIAVYGTKHINYSDKTKLIKLVKDIVPEIKETCKGISELGTAGLVLPCEKIGDFPVKNWIEGSWEKGAMKISGHVLKEKYLTGQFHCFSCPIGCGRKIYISKGKYKGVSGGGPEYETLGLFGGSCLIDDLEVICFANELCNRYGMDTIETGNLIAFSMEAYENGIITKEDTDGLEIKWGDAEVFIELIKEIGEVKGFGALLSQGFPVLINKYGNTAKKISMNSKNLSFPAHDPRASNSLALAYATSNRGACHCESFSYKFESNKKMSDILGIDKSTDRFTCKEKSELVAKSQDLMTIFDSLALCKFIVFGGVVIPKIIAEWLTLTTGINWTADELFSCGERIFTTKRLFNNKCGINRKDDILPERFLKSKRDSGSSENLPQLNEMLNEYYTFRGWDDNGIPSQLKVKQLKIY